jgi:aryl-alcohol dehydrogenase-like predicted oxidoreductase
MNYRNLGRTGLVVSEIGFGGWGSAGRQIRLDDFQDLAGADIDQVVVLGGTRAP